MFGMKSATRFTTSKSKTLIYHDITDLQDISKTQQKYMKKSKLYNPSLTMTVTAELSSTLITECRKQEELRELYNEKVAQQRREQREEGAEASQLRRLRMQPNARL